MSTHEHLGKSVVRSVQNLTSTTARQSHQRQSVDKTLWARVLRLAVLDCLGASQVTHQNTKTGLRDDALEWILSPDNGPSSFRWVCALFNLSPVAVREAIAAEARRRIPDKTSRRPMGARLKYWTTN